MLIAPLPSRTPGPTPRFVPSPLDDMLYSSDCIMVSPVINRYKSTIPAVRTHAAFDAFVAEQPRLAAMLETQGMKRTVVEIIRVELAGGF